MIRWLILFLGSENCVLWVGWLRWLSGFLFQIITHQDYFTILWWINWKVQRRSRSSRLFFSFCRSTSSNRKEIRWTSLFATKSLLGFVIVAGTVIVISLWLSVGRGVFMLQIFINPISREHRGSVSSGPINRDCVCLWFAKVFQCLVNGAIQFSPSKVKQKLLRTFFEFDNMKVFFLFRNTTQHFQPASFDPLELAPSSY